MQSNFKKDLSKEQVLGNFLNEFYHQKYNDDGNSFLRISNLDLQIDGIDLILNIEGTDYLIDEKAQLDYLNKSLPTFAFEISYIKNRKVKLGWLFDEKKKTDTYFLITNIQTIHPNSIKDGIKDCNITAVNRKNVKQLLLDKGLDERKIFEYSSKIRKSQSHGKHPIKELDSKTEGFFYYSFQNKNEQPINLVLYLKFLLKNKQVGKKIK